MVARECQGRLKRPIICALRAGASIEQDFRLGSLVVRPSLNTIALNESIPDPEAFGSFRNVHGIRGRPRAEQLYLDLLTEVRDQAQIPRTLSTHSRGGRSEDHPFPFSGAAIEAVCRVGATGEN